MTQKVIFVMGLPASGKTTWSKQKIKDSDSIIIRINKDDIRSMISNVWSKSNEDFVCKCRDLMIELSLEHKYSVIIDDTNFHPMHKESIQLIIDSYNKKYLQNVQLEIKLFNTPVNECIVRDKQRMNSVGEKVILNMYKQYKDKYNLDNLNPIQQNKTLPKAIIVDVDGTVAMMQNRNPYEWNKVSNDIPKDDIIEIVQMYRLCGYDIIFLSGRDSICYNETKNWLLKYVMNSDEDISLKLFMRTKNDIRPDEIVKKELFMEHVYNQFYIKIILDDRNKIVNMWRNLGLTCIQVANGHF